MDEKTRALLRHIRRLHWRLFEQQGEEIVALRNAIEMLHKSHEVIGRLIVADSELAGDEPDDLS